jgi:hypothetical protein
MTRNPPMLGVAILLAIAFYVVVALLFAANVIGRQGASITAGDGPYVFGGTYATFDIVADWQPAHRSGYTYWARIDCDAGLAQYQELTPGSPQQNGWHLGPTPLWSGGGSSCTLSLIGFGRADTTLATDTFEVLP